MTTRTNGSGRTPPRVGLRIGGQTLNVGSGGTFAHVNPATGNVQAEIPLAGRREMDEAVQTAAKAFEVWRRWKGSERGAALTRLVRLIERDGEEFSVRGALDTGTPVALGAAWPAVAAGWIDYYAGFADKIEGQVTSRFMSDGELSYTLPEPYGVVGIIITWNGALISLAMKVAPALAAGNTVVVKPSEMTPFASDHFASLVLEAGIPPGVVNILPGAVEAGEALVVHPQVQKISFTGGPVTARAILTRCAEHLKPAVLELGGKSANIIFPDANLDAACQWSAMFAVGYLSGQGCAFPSRILAQESIYKDVCDRIVAAARAIPVGDPFDPNVLSGPVVNRAAYERILALVERAAAQGSGRVLLGGKRIAGALDGFFIEPTVFADVDPKSELAQTEIFGPVVAITPFSSEDDAIRIANETSYGLAAYIQTRDITRAHRMAEQLSAGAVYINGATLARPNTPFGGVGISGFGREGGKPGLDEFLRSKTVAVGSSKYLAG